MSYIRGHEDKQFLVEDDGTVWDLNKTVRYDPDTLEPFVEMAEPDPVKAEDIGQDLGITIDKFKCPLCKYEHFQKKKVVRHCFLYHGKFYKEVAK